MDTASYKICLPCGHPYGRSCIEQWSREGFPEKREKCPKCNEKFKRKQIINVYGVVVPSTGDATAPKISSVSAPSLQQHCSYCSSPVSLVANGELTRYGKLILQKQRMAFYESERQFLEVASIPEQIDEWYSRFGRIPEEKNFIPEAVPSRVSPNIICCRCVYKNCSAGIILSTNGELTRSGKCALFCLRFVFGNNEQKYVQRANFPDNIEEWYCYFGRSVMEIADVINPRLHMKLNPVPMPSTQIDQSVNYDDDPLFRLMHDLHLNSGGNHS